MNMAEVCPFAMIFVPSERGISHAPEEFTQASHCSDGGRLLLAWLLALDAAAVATSNERLGTTGFRLRASRWLRQPESFGFIFNRLTN